MRKNKPKHTHKKKKKKKKKKKPMKQFHEKIFVKISMVKLDSFYHFMFLNNYLYLYGYSHNVHCPEL